LVSFGTQSKKDLEYDARSHFFAPFVPGLILFSVSVYILSFEIKIPNLKLILYSIVYISGVVLLHVAFSNISKKIFANLKKDLWNTHEESFAQNTKLVASDYMFNLPMQFFYNNKINEGWININVFRALMVIGTPGSGKTESVIIPFIKQFLAKGYAMVVYDFKYPDLAKITYYHYLLNHTGKGKLKDHLFHVVNLDKIEQSRRINPLNAKYIQTLGDASETAEAIISALMKTDKTSGSSQFFTLSAINFLAACIYFFATYKKGKFSTLPHVLAFMTMPYEKIFTTLFSNHELHTLLAPFKSAYDNRAFDQLEGQVGTVRINISRIATKEAFWIFSGNDFELKISNPASILVLANSPDTQNMNSAFYSAVLMRIVRLVNSKGNNPAAIVIDETPTLFLHKVENLIATARSNKVAVVLGLQEIPQFQLQYTKEVASTITSIMGSILSGAVRSKETLDWLEKLLGKIKQNSTGISIDRNKTNVSINQRMDSLIPASKIANLNAGELVGIVARENDATYGEYQPNLYNCKIRLNLDEIEEEKTHYKDLPEFYNFGSPEEKRQFLLQHMQNIFKDVESI
jgi:type IV secretory pathway TraG/TraD family ATPase VirD4